MGQWAVRMWSVVRPISFANNNAQTPHVDEHGRHSINYIHTALKHNLSLLNETVCCYSDGKAAACAGFLVCRSRILKLVPNSIFESSFVLIKESTRS
jgi:hypothetical protein